MEQLDINKVFFFFPNQRIFINNKLLSEDIIEIDNENNEILLKPKKVLNKKKNPILGMGLSLSKKKNLASISKPSFEDFQGLMKEYEELIYERNFLLLHSKVMEGMKKQIIDHFMVEFNEHKIIAVRKRGEHKVQIIKNKFNELNQKQKDVFTIKLRKLLKIPESYRGDDINFNGMKITKLNKVLRLFDSDEIKILEKSNQNNLDMDMDMDMRPVNNLNEIFKEKDHSKNIFTRDEFMDDDI